MVLIGLCSVLFGAILVLFAGTQDAVTQDVGNTSTSPADIGDADDAQSWFHVAGQSLLATGGAGVFCGAGWLGGRRLAAASSALNSSWRA